jgi:hypothetical protein
MVQVIERRGRHLGVAETRWAFAEGAVRSDDDGCAFVEPAGEMADIYTDVEADGRRRAALISFLEVKTWISLTDQRQRPIWSDTQRSGKMIIELAVLFAVVAVMGATMVKVYEWRQDVLYGPYRSRSDTD